MYQFGISSANNLLSLLLSVFESSMATLAYKALLLSGVFLPFMRVAFFLNSYSCWHCAIIIESHCSLEYFFNLFFESIMVSIDLLPLCRSGLADIGTLHAWCQCSCINMLSEKGNNCVKIICPDCGDCYRQLVTPDAIQQVLNFRNWNEALVPIFQKVFDDNMVIDMSGNILFPVPCLIVCIIRKYL